MVHACRRATSQDAVAIIRLVERLFPGKIGYILTDNGSEFQGQLLSFCTMCTDCPTGAISGSLYPRCPKMNAFNERFNRTIQEEFVAHHEDVLGDDLVLFNDLLFEYLGRYNFSRPHHGLDLKTPAYMLAASFPNLSHMLWQQTIRFNSIDLVL